MLSEILPYMRCPCCSCSELQDHNGTVLCTGCRSRYKSLNGILDMMGTGRDEVITPFQRLMQSSAIVAVYEIFWRRLGYFLASSRSFGKEMQRVLELVNDRSSRFLLDLACGTGVFTRPLARNTDGLVVGLDLSWPMLNRAQVLMRREGIRNIVFIRATAFHLPFIDAAFPYVNCCGALHLFDRPEAALQEIRRILAPGGRLCVQTTIRPERSAGLAYLLEHFIRFGFFGEEALRTMMRQHGFRLVESERHRISYTLLAEKQT